MFFEKIVGEVGGGWLQIAECHQNRLKETMKYKSLGGGQGNTCVDMTAAEEAASFTGKKVNFLKIYLLMLEREREREKR